MASRTAIACANLEADCLAARLSAAKRWPSDWHGCEPPSFWTRQLLIESTLLGHYRRWNGDGRSRRSFAMLLRLTPDELASSFGEVRLDWHVMDLRVRGSYIPALFLDWRRHCNVQGWPSMTRCM